MILSLLIIFSTQTWAKDTRITSAESFLNDDPIRAYELALTASDSEEKYLFLYSADIEIARRTPPLAMGENMYTSYVRQYPRRFERNGDLGSEFFFPSDYWLKKSNAKSAQFGELEFERISHAHSVYMSGKRSEEKKRQIYSSYSDWVKKYPRHKQTNLALARMRGLQLPN